MQRFSAILCTRPMCAIQMSCLWLEVEIALCYAVAGSLSEVYCNANLN